jgi:Helix-turn-helix domain
VNPGTLTLVPTWRLGVLLRSARERTGRQLDQMAEYSPHFDRDALVAIENGDRALDDADLEALIALYGIDPGAFVPERAELIIDLDQRELAAAGHTQALAGSDPSPDEVLGAYLVLVHNLRTAEPPTPDSLRQGDLDVLARVLALATPDVTERLRAMMVEPDPEVQHRSRLLRARVLVPAAGVLVAVLAGGTLVFVSRSAPTSPPPTSGQVDIGSPLVVTHGVGVSVVVGDHLTLGQVPAGGVGLAPAQVVTLGPDGRPAQSTRTAAAGSTTSTTIP